jgi:quinol monooxygenase YgiN
MSHESAMILDTTANPERRPTMASVFMRFRVDDYDRCKESFDQGEPLRQESGVSAVSVHREAHDPNAIIVASRWSDLGKAYEFYNSAALRQRTEAAGVRNPQFWFTEDVYDKKY